METRVLFETEIPPAKRPWIRARQIGAFKQLLGWLAAANTANAVLIAVLFWPGPQRWTAAGWAIVAAVMVCLPLLPRLRRRERKDRETRSTRSIWRVIHGALLSGAAWAALPLLLFADAGRFEQAVLIVACTGMMGGGAFMLATIPPAALTFTGLVYAGSIAVLAPPLELPLLLLCLLLTCYLVALTVCVRWVHGLFVRQLLGEAAANEKSQVIGLLLKEFEESTSDWLWQIDEDSRIVGPSPRFADVVKIPVRRLRGALLHDVLDNGEETAALSALIAQQRAFRDVAVPVITTAGRRWLSLSGQPVFDDGEFVGYRGAASDITVQRKAADRIAYLAHHDVVTGLPNRVALNQRLDGALGGETQSGNKGALLCFDLDGFKWVNDTLGHPAGDSLLRQVGERVANVLPAAALLTRLGGDEFAILLPPADATQFTAMAQTLIDTLAQPFTVHGTALKCSASVGIRLLAADDTDATLVLKQADLALHHAKAANRGGWRLFEPAMAEDAQRRLRLEAELAAALAGDELRLHLQPLWDIHTGRMVGCEALLRWQHPERGLLAPGAFLDVAETSGLIGPVGDWVVRRAIELLVDLPDDMTIAVNVSPSQLRNPDFCKVVGEALTAADIDPGRLELEVTESALFDGSDASLDNLREVGVLGVKVALDDFGTGFSSLSHLRLFPFDRIKIDKSFVGQIAERADCRAIIRSICHLAASLGMRTTAEGIETQEQLALVRAVGCETVQGYLLAKPLTPDLLKQRLGEPSPIAFTDLAA